MKKTIYEFHEELKAYLESKGIIIIEQLNEKDYYGFHFFTVLHNNVYFFVQFDYLRGNECTRHKKIGYNKKVQSGYSTGFATCEELYDYINEYSKYLQCPLKGVFTQNLHQGLNSIIDGKTRLYRMREKMGTREAEIFLKIDHIENKQKNDDIEILRFVAKNGDYFDYEINGERFINTEKWKGDCK